MSETDDRFEFDIRRFEALAEKAQDDTRELTDAEREELVAHLRVLDGALSDLVDVMAAVFNEALAGINEMAAAMLEAMEADEDE